MSRSLGFHPEAETELNDAADYYALQSPGLDRQFLGEIEQALAQIVAFPEASSLVHARTRRKVLLGSLLAHVLPYRFRDPRSRRSASLAPSVLLACS